MKQETLGRPELCGLRRRRAGRRVRGARAEAAEDLRREPGESDRALVIIHVIIIVIIISSSIGSSSSSSSSSSSTTSSSSSSSSSSSDDINILGEDDGPRPTRRSAVPAIRMVAPGRMIV